jgi:hypothetical protein
MKLLFYHFGKSIAFVAFILESMDLIAAKGGVVLTPCVALMFVTPEVNQNHLFFSGAV